MACRFFAGYRVRPDGIHFVMHADGRPSGMAFVEFDCPQEAMRALVSVPHLYPSLHPRLSRMSKHCLNFLKPIKTLGIYYMSHVRQLYTAAMS